MHWLPPARQGRRYSTWFFIARAPHGEVTIDDGEITDHRWTTPTEALRARDAGKIELVPPTWVTLHRLSRATSVVEALEEGTLGIKIGDPDVCMVLGAISQCHAGGAAIFHDNPVHVGIADNITAKGLETTGQGS